MSFGFQHSQKFRNFTAISSKQSEMAGNYLISRNPENSGFMLLFQAKKLDWSKLKTIGNGKRKRKMSFDTKHSQKFRNFTAISSKQSEMAGIFWFQETPKTQDFFCSSKQKTGLIQAKKIKLNFTAILNGNSWFSETAKNQDFCCYSKPKKTRKLQHIFFDFWAG